MFFLVPCFLFTFLAGQGIFSNYIVWHRICKALNVPSCLSHNFVKQRGTSRFGTRYHLLSFFVSLFCVFAFGLTATERCTHCFLLTLYILSIYYLFLLLTRKPPRTFKIMLRHLTTGLYSCWWLAAVCPRFLCNALLQFERNLLDFAFKFGTL